MKKRKVNKKISLIMLIICIATLIITDIIVRPFSKAEENSKAKTANEQMNGILNETESESASNVEKLNDATSEESNIFSGGNGTAESPYIITTAEELQLLAEKVNTYSEDTDNGGYYKYKHYILSNNIDFSGKTWIPIGTYDSLALSDCTTKYSFQGSFNGNGYVISNITYNITKIPNNRGTYGLFGMLWGDGINNASVYNVTIENMNINVTANGKSYREMSIGTIAGQLGKNSSIRNCIVRNSSITVNPTDSSKLLEIANTKKLSIGGLVGDTASNASDNSSAWERFTVTDDYGMYNCFVDVDITVHDETIKESNKWPADTSSNIYNRYTLGGIVGTLCFADKFPQNCVYTGTITATKPFIGNLYGKGEFVNLTRANYAKLFASDGSKGTEAETNYYYKYKVVNSELSPSKYEFNGEYANTVDVNGIKVHPITSDTTSMGYVQGVNRGNYTNDLGTAVSITLNTLAGSNNKYKKMSYDIQNDTVTFETMPEVEIKQENYKFTTILHNVVSDDESKLSYKWYIKKSEESSWTELENTSNILENLEQDIVDRELKVNVFLDGTLICSNTITINKETFEIWLDKIEEENNTIIKVNVNSSNGDTVDDFTYKWFYKGTEDDEYSLIENEDSYMYTRTELPEGASVKVIVSSNKITNVKKELEYVNLNAIYVDQANGNNSNDGKTKEKAVQTLQKAFNLLPDNKKAKDNVIVIVGVYDGWIGTNQLASNSVSFIKPATICGKYLGKDYAGTLKIANHTYLNADTIMKDITLTTSGNTFLYTQGNDLTMEESVIFGDGFGMIGGTANSWGISDIEGYMNLKRITIVGGTKDYHRDKCGEVKQRISNIVIRCKGIAVITGGSRTEGDFNADVYGTLENPANVNITIDIKSNDGTLDLGLLVGGQCDSSSFMNTEINVQNGKIARIVGGTLGYGNPMVGVPKDTFYGSTILYINGGTIKEIYCGPLGRNDKTSYMYGKVDLNINGGTINGNIYGAGAGGTIGYSSKYVDRMTDEFKSDTIYSPAGKTMKKLLADGSTEYISLENSVVNVNIAGGTINGNVYGGGYGESAYLKTYQIADDGGTLYGDVNLNISGGTVNGDVYGGGRGSSKYGDAKQEIAQIYGNVTVTITDDARITGNVFGGSEGIETYPDIGKITGSITLTISGKNVQIGGSNIMGSGNAGDIKGTVKVVIKDANLTSDVFGGGLGKTAVVNPPDDDNKSIYVSINNSKIIGDVYAGGDLGNVYGNVALYIGDKANITGSVYGGGNNANIGDENKNASTYVNVIGATIENVQNSKSNATTGGEVFGGGNYGVVYGNTNIEVGSKDDQVKTVIQNQMYAGGRGKTGVTTVTGNSSGQIIGTNTTVAQYGSSSLGKVDGDVNITFDNYKTTNNTDRYKVMSGINKATNLYLIDSYVYLTSGLSNIDNLYIPKKSGMLISEDSTLDGNFTGGGELYLQNRVTLTIKKDITAESEQTTLTLNPKMVADKGYFEIAGGEDIPYVVVLGTDYSASKTDESGNAIVGMVSGNKRKYEIKNKTNVDYSVGDSTIQKASIYYIEDTIKIPGYATEKISNEKGRIFSSTITNSDDVYILDNGTFSSQIGIDYNMIRQKDESGSWKLINDTEMKNLRRYLYITGKDEAMKVPAGTVITMIVNNTYYTYKVPENYGTQEFWNSISADSKYLDLGSSTVENLENEIPICLFTDSNGNQFTEVKNIQEKMNVNEDSTENICTVSENYKFIIDFSNCTNLTTEELQEILGSHEVVFDIWDYKVDSKNNIIQEETFKDKKYSNDVHIESRKYKAEYEDNIINVTTKGNITTNIVFTANEMSTANTSDIGKKIVLKITINNQNEDGVTIPTGTVIKINGTECNIQEDEILYTVVDSVSTGEYNEKTELQIDMSNVEDKLKLANDTYKLKVEAYIASNENGKDVLLGNYPIATVKQDFVIGSASGYGIMVTINEKTNNSNIPMQIITEAEQTARTVNVTYQKGSIDGNISIKAKTYKKNSDGNYEELEQNFVTKDTIALSESKSLIGKSSGNYTPKTVKSEVVFANGTEKGTYRIEYSLCDANGDVMAEDFINFIVK